MKQTVISYCLAIFMSTTTTFAQHCPFDNTCILVLQIVNNDDFKDGVTPYLTPIKKNKLLTLLNNKSYSYSEFYPFSERDSTFFKNRKETIFDTTSRYCFKCMSYSFAKDHYVRPISLDFKEYNNLAIAFKNNKGEILDFIYKLKPGDFYDLHAAFGHNWFDAMHMKTTPPPAVPFNNLITVSLKNVKIKQ